jgi:Domain of unknown function (DUF4252)
MNKLFRTSLKLTPVLLLLLASATVTTRAQSGKLQLDQLDALSGRASQTTEIKLDEHLIQITAKLFSGNDKDDQDVKELLKNLKGIYVKSFQFEKEGEYSPTEVDSVLSQLRGAGWNKIVGVTSRKSGNNVDVYIMTIGDQINGMAVVSLEPKELTIVNIVGPINLEKLSGLEGSFGVPDLELRPPKTKNDKLIQ